MPTIRVEDAAIQALKDFAEPFVDTPNTVILKLVAFAKANGYQKASSARVSTPQEKPSDEKQAARGSLTPQSTYETFLLHVLGTKYGGTGHKNELTQAVVDLMKSRGFIRTAEMERVSTGETRADNTVAWARNALKERGLISRKSKKGVWELTPEGMQEAEKIVLLPRRAAI